MRETAPSTATDNLFALILSGALEVFVLVGPGAVPDCVGRGPDPGLVVTAPPAAFCFANQDTTSVSVLSHMIGMPWAITVGLVITWNGWTIPLGALIGQTLDKGKSTAAET